MKLKCPYCGCCYDISSGELGQVSGNEKLGFGWWLRCWKCKKKFWLSSTKVIDTTFTPEKASYSKKRENISKILSKSNKKSQRKRPLSLLLISGGLIALSAYAIYIRHDIQQFFVHRILNILDSTSNSLELSHMTFKVNYEEGRNLVLVKGFIINKTPVVQPINGIRFILFDHDNEIDRWEIQTDIKNILPGDKSFFASDHIVQRRLERPRLQVEIVKP